MVPEHRALHRPLLSFKMYGVLHEALPAGYVLQLLVANRYNAYGWSGSKIVILPTQSWYGMRNPVPPRVLLAMAAVDLVGAALLMGLAMSFKRSGQVGRTSIDRSHGETPNEHLCEDDGRAL